MVKGLNRIRLGQYYPIASPIHRLDARVKMACALAVLAAAFAVNRPGGVLFLLLFSLAVVYLAKLPPRQVLFSLRSVLVLLLITGFAQLLFSPGREVARWGPFTVTNTGIENGVVYSLRLVTAVITLGVLTMATSPVELLDGLEGILSPLRRLGFPAREAAMILATALRFLPLLVGRAGDIAKAQEARGADFRSGNPLRRARSLFPILVPLFTTCFRDAQELGAALASRGYHGSEGRTSYRARKIHPGDLAALAATALLVAAAVLFPA